MRNYDSGNWGLSSICGLKASVFPRAAMVAMPSAMLAFAIAELWPGHDVSDASNADSATKMMAGFTSVMFFVLYFRSNIAYNRWWEGGTLLQKTRGEWFNAYSSLLAFSSTDPALERDVEVFQHVIARLMSLLFCCALQQVSPNKERALEVIDLTGIDPESLAFLKTATDKVEVILQWVQRTAVDNMAASFPLRRPSCQLAFQEISRGIVNLQNARKIADFPFPFPYAQVSIAMLVVHWCITPIVCCMSFNDWIHQRSIAIVMSFAITFAIWSINFIALALETPFGSKDNDLPMDQMQHDWNNSLTVLLCKKGQQSPQFNFDPDCHRQCNVTNSNAIDLPPDTCPMRRGLRSVATRSSRENVESDTLDKDRCSFLCGTSLGGSRAVAGSAGPDLHEGDRPVTPVTPTTSSVTNVPSLSHFQNEGWKDVPPDYAVDAWDWSSAVIGRIRTSRLSIMDEELNGLESFLRKSCRPCYAESHYHGSHHV